MVEKVRHQLFLPKPVSDRLEALAAKPGASKSAILTDAVTAWLNRRGASELEDRFGIRLDRLTAAIGRLERDSHVQIETLEIGRAHVRTPVTNAQLVCRLLLEKTTQKRTIK